MSDNRPATRMPDPYEYRKRSSATSRVFGSLIGWGLILGLFAVLVVGWAYTVFTATGPLQAEKVVMLPEGSSRSEIALALKDAGVISNERVFSAAAAAKGLRGVSLKPGEYRFEAGTTMQDVLALITSGKVVTYKLTIPEGWTSEMALGRIRENDVLTGDLSTTPAEGSLMADTFVFRRGMTRQEIIAQMTSTQAKLVDELWAAKPADSPIKSKLELVTMASIVEKETGKAEERPLVAAVFLNRLKQGMRLQSDPTIIYGLAGGKGKLDRPITRADIDSKTPYNTYQIDGLPPGPIGNPGKASLEAVINPAPVKYLYFVADGTGGHAFATTLEEHNANVAKWRKVEAGTDALPAQQVPAAQPAAQAAAAASDAQQQASTGLDNLQLDPAKSGNATIANPPATVPATAKPDDTDASAAAPVAVQAAANPPAAATPPADPLPPLDETPIDLKPGSILHIGNKLVPVPEPKVPK